MDDTRTCPYCAETIPAAAVRCRFCRSRVSAFDPREWHRDQPERRLAGVAAAIARPLALPLGIVRVAFLALTFLHLLGPALYGMLWLLIPFRSGEEPPITTVVARARSLAGQLWRTAAPPPRP